MAFAVLVASLCMAPKVVLISGDEEYRSEEMLPQLAKILEKKHRFRCQVVYSVDEKGLIDPNSQLVAPSLRTLQDADLVILMTRFRHWDDQEMSFFDAYCKSGKPFIGIRTATHAFAYPPASTSSFAHYSWDSPSWNGGFGKQILGETWVAHHGSHMQESTRAVPPQYASLDPILNGITDLWVPTDVYVAHPSEAKVLLQGQVLDGMTPQSQPVEGSKNDPMMPVAWKIEKDHRKVFTTTMGSAVDFMNEDFRRLLVNASFWATGRKIPTKADVRIVGKYDPSPVRFGAFKKGVKPTID